MKAELETARALIKALSEKAPAMERMAMEQVRKHLFEALRLMPDPG